MIPKKEWYYDEVALREMKDECEYLECTMQELYYLKSLQKIEDIAECVNNLHVVVVDEV